MDVGGVPLHELYLTIGYVVGLVGSAVIGIVAFRGRAGTGPFPDRRRRLTTGLLVAGAWAGYLGGDIAAHRAGPSVDTIGTLRVTLGAPFGNDVLFEATCTSVVGDPASVAWITAHMEFPHDFSVTVHDPYTGGSGDGLRADYSHPSLLVPDPSDDAQPGSVVQIPREGGYYGPREELVEQDPRHGTLTATYERVPDAVNSASWPATFVMRAEWSCPNLGQG